MPLFEYRCSECAHLEEVLQKYDDPAPDPCPQCGKPNTMSREVSMTSFHLKGGGWYKDLYSSTPKGGTDSSASSSSASSSTSSSSSASSSSASSSSSSSSGESKKSSSKDTKAA